MDPSVGRRAPWQPHGAQLHVVALERGDCRRDWGSSFGSWRRICSFPARWDELPRCSRPPLSSATWPYSGLNTTLIRYLPTSDHRDTLISSGVLLVGSFGALLAFGYALATPVFATSGVASPGAPCPRCSSSASSSWAPPLPSTWSPTRSSSHSDEPRSTHWSTGGSEG